MKNRHLALFFIATVTVVAIVFSACQKIKETDLGSGLIPPIDNITTFDTLMDVMTYNDTFAFANDSVRLAPTDEFFLGKITNDPYFGTSDAEIFMELKPASFPHLFRNKPDSLRIDSVVLILDYVETYGDTMAPQTISVFQMNQSPQNSVFKSDSFYLIRRNDFTSTVLLGSRTVIPATLKDSVKAYGGDTTNRQLRIKLANIFGQTLLSYDTSSSITNGAYGSDSAFKNKVRGFHIKSTGGGNALMGFNLAGANTKLAIYYKYDNILPNVDTTVAYFQFGSISASANYIKRDYTGTPALATLNNGLAPDPIVYIQKSPGMFATIKIPGLNLLNNRVIHRAELVMEQLYDISDSTFRSPDFLYVDAYDPSITTTTSKYRTIPYDMDYDASSGFPLVSFGIVPKLTNDGLGNRVRTWRINISRYVQHILTQTQTSYDLRLHAPLRVTGTTRVIGSTADVPVSFLPNITYVNPAVAKGRIRLIGNTGPGDLNPRRMKLRVIYSKL